MFKDLNVLILALKFKRMNTWLNDLRNKFEFLVFMESWILWVCCKVSDPKYSWFHEYFKNGIYYLYNVSIFYYKYLEMIYH